MERFLTVRLRYGLLIVLSAVFLIHPLRVWSGGQAGADPAFTGSLAQARQEIAEFDKTGKLGDADDPRRRWADYFWQYYEDHNDHIEGSHAAGRALRWLADVKEHEQVIQKSRDIDPQNPAWAYGGIQALSKTYEDLDQFHEFFEKATGLLGVTLDPMIRDATRLALADFYVKQNQFDKAQPLLEATVAESSHPALLRSAKRQLCELPYRRKGDRPGARDGWQMPQQVLSALGVRRGSVVADIGAGHGYFTFRLAAAVGRAGKVYAVDIDPGVIQYLQAQVAQRRLTNVHLVRGSDGDPHLPKSACDVILFVDAYHEVKDRPAMLAQVKRALKRRGVLAVIDHFPLLGEDHFLPEETIRSEITAAGFKLDLQETFLPSQFMLVFRK